MKDYYDRKSFPHRDRRLFATNSVMAAGRGEFFRSLLEGLERKPAQPNHGRGTAAGPGRGQSIPGRGQSGPGRGQSGPGKRQTGRRQNKKKQPKASLSSVSGKDGR